jgi:putative intracellular protease/amidase
MASQKIAIALTNHRTLGDTGKPTGFWLSEMTHPYFVFRHAALEVDLISPKGGLAPIEPKSEHLKDPENREFMENPELKAKLEKTRPASSLDPNDYAAVFFAGGHWTNVGFSRLRAAHFTRPLVLRKGGRGRCRLSRPCRSSQPQALRRPLSRSRQGTYGIFQ